MTQEAQSNLSKDELLEKYRSALDAAIHYIEDGGDTDDFFVCRELWRDAIYSDPDHE